jgi:hypothetical protein
MLWCRRIKRRLRRWYHKEKSAEQRIYWLDTVKMTRFWVALGAALLATIKVVFDWNLAGYPNYMYVIYPVFFFTIWWVVGKFIDWVCPI